MFNIEKIPKRVKALVGSIRVPSAVVGGLAALSCAVAAHAFVPGIENSFIY